MIIILTTKDAFAAARSTLNVPLNVFDKSCFSKFVSVMVNVSPKTEAALVTVKKVGS